MASQPLWHALGLLGAYLGFCLLTWHRYRQRTVSTQPELESQARSGNEGHWLVAFASQGGTAERLAEASAERLRQGQQAVTLLPLNQVDEQLLQVCKKALFVVSTYGEGEPPDNGVRFARRCLSASSPLAGIDYGVLALGDSSYQHFCAFGHQLHQGLRARGAHALFEPLTVDREDTDTLNQWQSRLVALGAAGDAAPLAANDDQPFGRWGLAEREWLNVGSPGGPVYHLRLTPEDDIAREFRWQSGDIAQIELRYRGKPLIRDYSIASLTEDGALELLVRQHQNPDGSLGLGSGWLTRDLATRGKVTLRIRRNPGFHLPGSERPLILIGNGTGIAGLRAHLKARDAQGAWRNWLLFGERTRQWDQFYQTDLEGWLGRGHLARMDLTFSRDPGGHAYVQDALRSAATTLRTWVEQGACIYVCGSRRGMAGDVDRVLREVLGNDRVDQLQDNQHYRRDIY